MPDLIFTSQGQAEVLAAQEEVARKGREMRNEFEQGAKSVGAWDSEMTKLKRTSESALRSIKTEQEKISEQIVAIKEAQEKGLIPPEEAEKGIEELKKRWVEVDEATQANIKASEEFQSQQTRLKSAAESALRSVQTESDRVREKIEAVQEAMEAGLIPEDQIEEAKEGLEKLKEKLQEIDEAEFADLNQKIEGIGDTASNTADRISATLKKAFDPMQIVKVGVSFVGVKAAFGAMKAELADLQNYADNVADAQFRRLDELETKIADATGAKKEDVAAGKVSREDIAGALSTDEQRQYSHLKRRRARQDAIKRGTDRLMYEGDEEIMSEAEIAQLDKLMQGLGKGVFERWAAKRSQRPLGTFSETDAERLITDAQQEIQMRLVRDRFGVHAAGTNERIARASLDATPEQRRQLEVLEEMLRVLKTGDGGLPIGGE